MPYRQLGPLGPPAHPRCPQALSLTAQDPGGLRASPALPSSGPSSPVARPTAPAPSAVLARRGPNKRDSLGDAGRGGRYSSCEQLSLHSCLVCLKKSPGKWMFFVLCLVVGVGGIMHGRVPISVHHTTKHGAWHPMAFKTFQFGIFPCLGSGAQA